MNSQHPDAMSAIEDIVPEFREQRGAILVSTIGTMKESISEKRLVVRLGDAAR